MSAIRLLVCGGRTFRDEPMLEGILNRFAAKQRAAGHEVDVVMTGAQTGADVMAETWARRELVTVQSFVAAWEVLGPRAGPERNQRMLVEGMPTHAIAFPGGDGTADMVRRCLLAEVETYAVDIDGRPHRITKDDLAQFVTERRAAAR